MPGAGVSIGPAWPRQNERRERATMRGWRRKSGDAAYGEGRLQARLGGVSNEAATFGLQSLKLDERRDALLYVPTSYRPKSPVPLALMLHGAGGDAEHGLSLLQRFAEESGFIILAPASRRQTWDVIAGGYGPDVAFIDQALEETFSRYAIEPARIAIGGFSDGASYALSLGVANGELFTHVIAFSPGFVAAAHRQGMPALFISHGTEDRVLPIDYCSRRIRTQVESAGYELLYREFDGGHTVPARIAREAVEWFLGREE